MGIRLRLISYWQIIWKKWSVRLNALGIAVLGYLTLAPDAITQVWLMLPDDVKSYVPVKFSLYIPLIMFVLGLLANYIKQEKLEQERKQREYDGKA